MKVLEGLASAAHAIDVRIDRFHAFELHFKVVDTVTDLHVLEHIPAELGFQAFDFLLEVFLCSACCLAHHPWF
jgi:hypothetical protein